MFSQKGRAKYISSHKLGTIVDIIQPISTDDSVAAFLYCCPACPRCLAHLNKIGWATWTIWAAIKKYSLIYSISDNKVLLNTEQ